MTPSSSALLVDEETDLRSREEQGHLQDELIQQTTVDQSLPPDWFDWAQAELTKFALSNECDWNDELSDRPNDEVLEAAQAVLRFIARENPFITAPYIVPGSDGRILFEWSTPVTTLDVEITHPTKVAWLFRNRESDVSYKGWLRHNAIDRNFFVALNQFTA